MNRPLTLIAAVARNGAIGVRNGLPWRLSADLKHFRALTMGKPVILGRKTWQSIGRPLPGRALVVVSRDVAFALPPEIALARDPEDALARAQAIAVESGADEVMVAGGAAIYAALLGKAERLRLTEVDAAPEADAFFPPVDKALWRETAREAHSTAPGEVFPFAFVTYERR